MSADAQRKITWGLKVSTVLSTLQNEKDYYNVPDFWDPKLGGAIGGFGRYAIAKRWSVQADFGYCLAGASSQGGGDPLNVHYVPVPISIGYTVWKKVRFFAGPQFNVFLGKSREYTSYDFKSIDIGAQAGVEYRVSSKWSLFAKSYYGFAYNDRIDLFISEVIDVKPFHVNRNVIHELGVYFYLPSRENKE